MADTTSDEGESDQGEIFEQYLLRILKDARVPVRVNSYEENSGPGFSHLAGSPLEDFARDDSLQLARKAA